jgi:NADPH:quinone reductase-like Zn-dependent oxidoreductase
LIDRVAAESLPVAIGRVFQLDDIVQAHRVMENNEAGGKIVVLTR